ncbi:heme oxygenase [Sphingobacteriaceae bacterium]|nr:heme oxygenase [Sphingobacteriaceae bacterium]
MQPHATQTPLATEKDTFLKDLRSVTSPAHKKLEETSLSKVIVSETLLVGDYALYLEKMYLAMVSFEKKIFPILNPHFSDLDQRIKTNLLEKDLKFLGVKVPEKQSLFNRFVATRSTSYLMGAFYVLEGSTLGGKFIYKNISSTLGLTAESGASYFNGYGAETGKLWSAFMEQFCNYALKTSNQKEIIQGADDTFKLLFDLLNA